MKRTVSINLSQTDKLHLPSLSKQHSEVTVLKNKTTNISGVVRLNEIDKKQQELNMLKTKQQMLCQMKFNLQNKIDNNYETIRKLEGEFESEESCLEKEEKELEDIERIKLELISKIQREKDEMFEEESKLSKLTRETDLLKCFKEEKGEILCQLIKEYKKIRYLVPQKSPQILEKENVFNSNKTHKKSQFYNQNHSNRVSHFIGNR